MFPVMTSSPGFQPTQVAASPVPTMVHVSHSGMCCALNANKTLQNSTYSRLVEEMQGKGEKRRVPASAGKKDGLTLILDLHSNQAALGTVNNNYDAFNIFKAPFLG